MTLYKKQVKQMFSSELAHLRELTRRALGDMERLWLLALLHTMHIHSPERYQDECRPFLRAFDFRFVAHNGLGEAGRQALAASRVGAPRFSTTSKR